jgi:hypothetical protein
MLHGVWLKVLAPLAAVAYVGYRLTLAVQVARARRAGDQERVERLTTRGFGLYRWAVGLLLLVIVLLLLVVLTNRT